MKVLSEFKYSDWYVYWDNSLFKSKEMQPCYIWHIRAVDPAVVSYKIVSNLTDVKKLFQKHDGVSEEDFSYLNEILKKFVTVVDEKFDKRDFSNTK